MRRAGSLARAVLARCLAPGCPLHRRLCPLAACAHWEHDGGLDRLHEGLHGLLHDLLDVGVQRADLAREVLDQLVRAELHDLLELHRCVVHPRAWHGLWLDVLLHAQVLEELVLDLLCLHCLGSP
eukprot:687284-Alexandrium_andersonii.AAC.1